MKQNNMRPTAWKVLLAVASVCAYLFGSLILSNTPTVEAAIPKYINFQGKITQVSDGTNVSNGTYAFEFKLYDASTSGTLLWTETFDQPSGACGKLTVTNGVFNAKLGTCASLASVDFTGGSLYLSVNFAPTGTSYDGEMSPRKQLLASAFAFVANGVSGDGTVQNTVSSATALTVAKAGNDYALQVDTSAGSAATGLKVTSNAATSGLALAVISSGTNESLTLDAKGSGSMSLGATSTGDILLGGGSASTGCTVTNSTGAFACTAGGSFTTLGLTGAVTGAASYNGLVITANTGVVTTGTWQGTAVADTYVADTLTVDSSSSVHWNALNSYPAACSAGSAISALADTTNTCTAFNTDTSITLQDAYDATSGNTITTTSARNIALTFAANTSLTLDAAATDTTQTSGVIDLDVDSSTTLASAIDINFEGTGSTSSATQNGVNLIMVPSNSTNARTYNGIKITNPDTGSVANTIYGLNVDVTTSNSSDTTYAAIFQGGNVGITTATPAAKLEITTGSDATISPLSVSAYSHPYITITNAGSSYWDGAINLFGDGGGNIYVGGSLLANFNNIYNGWTGFLMGATRVVSWGSDVNTHDATLQREAAGLLAIVTEPSSTTYRDLKLRTLYAETSIGLATSAPDRPLEINSATGLGARLTYNDSDGSAANYVDLQVGSAGEFNLQPSGFIANVGGGTSRTALRFLEPSGTGTDYAAIQSNANVTTSYTWTLPAADASGCIQSNGSGTLSISACGGGSQTPWTSDIDADGYDLKDLSNIEFRDTTGAPAGSVVAIFSDNTGDLNINSLTGKTTNIQVNGTDEYNFSSTGLAFNSNNITGLGTALTAAAGLTITATSADLALVTATSGNITLAPASTGSVQLTSGVTSGTGTSAGLSAASSTLTSGSLVDLTVTGTGALTNQKGINVSLSGANGTGAQTTYGGYFSNTHTGTSINVGLYATATGGSSNYAGIFEAGNVGIGDTTPDYTLELAGSTAPKFALSDAELTHGITTWAETDSYFLIDQATNDDGGARLWGFSDSVGQNPMQLIGAFGADPTDTIPALRLRGVKKTGTTITTLDDAETLLQVDNNGTTRFTILGSGNVGIGTVTPTQKLAVADGSILVNSTSSFTPSAMSGGFDAGAFNVNTVVVSGKYLYMGKAGSDTATCTSPGTLTGCELSIFDISNPNSITNVAGINITDGVNAIAVSGKHLYFGTNSNGAANELRIYDISNPGVPVSVTGISYDQNLNSIFIQGKLLFLGFAGDNSTGTEFKIYDISNPASPGALGTVDTAGASGGAGGVKSIYVNGKYAYLGLTAITGTCTGTAGTATGCEFRIYDISDPASPSYKAGVDATVDVNTVAISGKYAYTGWATISGNDLRIYDISDSTVAPTAAGGIDLSTGVNHLQVYGRYIYAGLVSASGNDFRLIDASDPTTPTNAGGVDVSVDTKYVYVSGKYAYVGLAQASGNDVRIYDVAGTDTPTLAAGSAGIGQLQVTDNARIENELTVGSALNVGLGGIQSSGAISLESSVLGGGANAVAGLFGTYSMTPSVGNAQYGNRFVATINDNNGNSSTTEVGTLMRMIDNSNDAQVVRALEVQAYSGTNTAGINTGIQTYGYTYGIYATTTAQANAVDVPAAVLANLDNGSATTSGNAIRAYTSTATSADLVNLQQTSSTFTGNALLMNMAAGSGTFSGNFMDLQKNSTSKFTISNTGRTDIKIADADDTVALYINTEESTNTRAVFQIETDASVTGDATTDNVKFAILADGRVNLSLNAGTSQEAVCFSAPGGADNNTSGVEPDADLYDCSGNPQADYAESYPTESNVNYGDVVALGRDTAMTYDVDLRGNIDWNKPLGEINRLAKSSQAYQTNLLGVVSNNYSDFASTGYNVKDSDRPMPVALNGRVNVNVTNENGNIAAGDFLTSSATHPGYAMKATHSGQIIGQSLASFSSRSQNSIGKVMVFVTVGYQSIGNTIALDSPTSTNLNNMQGSGSAGMAASNSSSTFVIHQEVSADETVADILQVQSGEANRFMVSNTGALTLNSVVKKDVDLLVTVKRGDDEKFTINARGDVEAQGVIVIRDDNFAGSIVTGKDGMAEITFTYNLGNGKPSIQLTPENETPIFAQVKEWRKDKRENYTGFVIKTFGLDGHAKQSTVHYLVIGKPKDYKTFGEDELLDVTDQPTSPTMGSSNNSGTVAGDSTDSSSTATSDSTGTSTNVNTDSSSNATSEQPTTSSIQSSPSDTTLEQTPTPTE